MYGYGRFKFFDFLVYRVVMRNPKLRGFLQKIIYPSGEKSISLLGQNFLIDVQSEIGYYRASIANNSNIYFRDELPQFISFVSKLSDNTIFVDAGANIGTWSVQIASLGNLLPNLKVIAFEPHPRTFEKLKKNCSPFNNIELHNLALSDSESTLQFFETTTSGVFSVAASHFNEGDQKKKMAIKAQPIDNFLVGKSNIALKIDVEGHEIEVLRGAKRALECNAIDVIFSDGVNDSAYKDFCLILENYKFDIFNARTRNKVDKSEMYHAIIAVRTS